MSTEIDWSKAPEGATHWAPATDRFFPSFMKLENGQWFCQKANGRGWAIDTSNDCSCRYIPRPSPWSGEGLPPVGTVCEYQVRGYGEWHRATILAHHNGHAWATGDDEKHCFTVPPHGNFRPIKTPEQIAAEERLDRVHAIEGIMLRGQELALTVTQIAAAIDDAGYRKVEGGEK